MAKTKTTVTKPTTGRALVNWEEKLAAGATVAAKMEESTATGQFFSIRGGILKFNDARIDGDRMGVIIAASTLTNLFYDTDFDPEDPRPPRCFAFGTDEKTMEPHVVSVDSGNAQNDRCGQAGQPGCCPMNEWATANKGRGKACRNVRRLALVPAGEYEKDGKFVPYSAEVIAEAGVGYLHVPVTSVKPYAAWVKQTADVLRRPPWGVFCEIAVAPDEKNQVSVTFKTIGRVPDGLLDAAEARSIEQAGAITFPYAPPDDAERPAPAARAPQRAVRPVAGRSVAPAGGGRPPVRRGGAPAADPTLAPAAKSAGRAAKPVPTARPAPAPASAPAPAGKRAARF